MDNGVYIHVSQDLQGCHEGRKGHPMLRGDVKMHAAGSSAAFRGRQERLTQYRTAALKCVWYSIRCREEEKGKEERWYAGDHKSGRKA